MMKIFYFKMKYKSMAQLELVIKEEIYCFVPFKKLLIWKFNNVSKF